MMSNPKVIGVTIVTLIVAACGGDGTGATKPVNPQGAAVAVAIAGTNNQSATVNTAVATPPGVHVTDAVGSPVANVTVTFAVTAGGGTVTTPSATTDATGNAFAGSWKVGTVAGTNTLSATVTGAPPVTFTATGVASVATQVTAKSTMPQTAAAGSDVTPVPSVLVADAFGNPIAGVAVTFSVVDGGGSVTGPAASTNASGVATVGSWKLGTTLGSNSLRASATGLPNATFSVTAVAGPATSLNVTPSSLTLRIPETAQLSVSAADQFGNTASASYATSAAGVATVSSTGLLTSIAAGQATITVTAGSLSKSVSLTVVTPTHPSGVLSKRISGINGRPFGIAISPSGLIAVTQQDLNSITFVDAAGASTRVVAVGTDPGDVVFNRAGTRAWVSNFISGSVSVIDVASGSTVATIPISTNAYRLVLSADESRLFVSTTGGSLYVVNTATNTASLGATIGGSLQGMTADANKDFLYITSTSGNVSRVSTATLAVVSTRLVGGIPQDVALGPNGGSLYVANESGWVDVLDPVSLAPIGGKITLVGAFGLAVTPDGQQLYVTAPSRSVVSVVDVATRTFINTLNAATPRRIAFDYAGAFAVIANEGGFVDVIR